MSSSESSSTNSFEPPFRKFFLLEAGSALGMILFGLLNIFGSHSALHAIVALYILVGGVFLSAIAVRRRRGPPVDLPDSTNGLVKAIEKLAGTRPFGFTCLAVSPLLLGYGGFGLVVFLLLYFSSVNAMRLSEEEMMSWIGNGNANLATPRAGAKKDQ